MATHLQKWQPLSVHILDCDKILATYTATDKNQWEKLHPNEKGKALVQRVIKLANRVEQRQKPAHLFDEVKIPDAPQEGFCLQVYYRRVETVSALASYYLSLGATNEFGTAYEEFINFYSRAREGGITIYVTATHQAWRVFNRFRDFQAPLALAEKLGDPKLIEFTARPILGKKIAQTSKFEEGEKISASQGYGKLFYQFKTKLVKPSPLVKNKILKDADIELFVGQGSLRLETTFSPEKFPALFECYDSILTENEETYEPTKHEEFDPFEFMKSLKFANSSLSQALDQALLDELWEAFQRPNGETCLRSMHRRVLDFCNSNKYSLHSRLIPASERLKFSWFSRETVSDLICRLKQIPHFSELKEKLKKKDTATLLKQEFQDHLKAMRLHFESENKIFKPLLIDCIEGEIILPTTMAHYFRLGGRWYEISFDSLSHYFRDFQILLEECLIKTGEEGELPTKWQREKKQKDEKRSQVEGDYNLSYVDEENFLVGDTVCPSGVELFDLLFIAEDKLYLYQVKEEFNHKARDASSQIINAAKLIGDAITQQKNSLLEKWLKILKEKSALSTNYKKLLDMAKIKHDDKEADQKSLKWLSDLFLTKSRDQIVFVYAFANKTASDRYLEDDLVLWQALNVEQLAKLAPDFEKESLYQVMKETGYLDQKGRICWKFISCNQEEFVKSLSSIKKGDKNRLYEDLKKETVSKFESTVARFSILDARNKVEKKGFTFKICQIPHEKAQDRTLPSSQSLSSILQLSSLPHLEKATLLPGSYFKCLGSSYQVQDSLMEGDPMISAVAGKQYSREEFINELRKKLQEEEQAWRPYLENQAMRLINALLPTDTKKEENAIFFKEFLKEKGWKLDTYLQPRRKFERIYAESEQQVMPIFQEYCNKMLKKNDNNFIQTITGITYKPEPRKKAYQKLLTNDQGILSQEKVKHLFIKKMGDIIKLLDSKGKGGAKKDKKDLKNLLEKTDLTKRSELEETLKKQGDLVDCYLSCLEADDYPDFIEELEIAASLFRHQIVLCHQQNEEVHYQWIEALDLEKKSDIKVILLDREESRVLFYPCILSEKKIDTAIKIPEAEAKEISIKFKKFTATKKLTQKSGLKKKILPILTEGQIFKYGESQYKILPTRGDGACGLHALLGEISGNEVCTETTREEVADLVLETLNNSQEAQEQFATLVFDIFTCLKNDQTGEYDELLLNNLGPLLKPHFKHTNPDFAAIAEKCLPIWVACIKDSGYYFSAGDLQIVAMAYGVELIIVNQNAIESPNPPGELPEETRIIFHRGLHFSLCELKRD